MLLNFSLKHCKSKFGKHCLNRTVPWDFCRAPNSGNQFCVFQNRAWTLWPWDQAVRLPEISEVDKHITSQYCRCFPINCHWAVFSENTEVSVLSANLSENISHSNYRASRTFFPLIYCWQSKNILEKIMACCWDYVEKTWKLENTDILCFWQKLFFQIHPHSKYFSIKLKKKQES